MEDYYAHARRGAARVCGEVERASMRGCEGCGGFYRTAHPIAQHMQRASLLKDRHEAAENRASNFFGSVFLPDLQFWSLQRLPCFGAWKMAALGDMHGGGGGDFAQCFARQPKFPLGESESRSFTRCGGPLGFAAAIFCPASGARQRRLQRAAHPDFPIRPAAAGFAPRGNGSTSIPPPHSCRSASAFYSRVWRR